MENNKIRFSSLARGLGRRVFSPRHAAKALQLHRHRKVRQRTDRDLQLALYAKIMGDHLHLGFFLDPTITPQEVSLGAIRRAQENYASLLVDQIVDSANPVLDVGCGMGGLLGELERRGIHATGLTPDEGQVTYLRKTRSSPIWQGRFEEISDFGNRFGTLITSESLQYLDKRILLTQVKAALKPKGRWIIADYLFRNSTDPIRPNWNFIENGMTEAGFEIVHSRDITANVLPTVQFLHFLGNTFGVPIFEFLEMKLNQREPGLAYLLEDSVATLKAAVEKNLSIVSPERFMRDKSYRLIVAELK